MRLVGISPGIHPPNGESKGGAISEITQERQAEYFGESIAPIIGVMPDAA